MVNISNLSYYSEVNFLKRDDSLTGTINLAVGSSSTSTHVINHNLGYIPFFTLSAELENNNGVIWSNSIVPRHPQAGAGAPNLQIEYYITTTQVIIRLDNRTVIPAIARSARLYWAIYLDYGNV